MGFREVIFPLRHDRAYGLASASFLVIVVMAEIEALAFVAVGLIAHRVDLFLELQVAVAPAGFLLAVAAALAVWIQQRAVRQRIKLYADVRTTAEVSAFAERIATRHSQR